MSEKEKINSKQELSDDSKLFAFLAVLLSIIGFIIAILSKKDDDYVMFYAKQSLILFIAWVIFWASLSILVILTFGLFAFLAPIIGVIFVVFWIIQIIYSLSGEKRETPLIGKFAEKIKL